MTTAFLARKNARPDLSQLPGAHVHDHADEDAINHGDNRERHEAHIRGTPYHVVDAQADNRQACDRRHLKQPAESWQHIDEKHDRWRREQQYVVPPLR